MSPRKTTSTALTLGGGRDMSQLSAQEQASMIESYNQALGAMGAEFRVVSNSAIAEVAEAVAEIERTKKMSTRDVQLPLYERVVYNTFKLLLFSLLISYLFLIWYEHGGQISNFFEKILQQIREHDRTQFAGEATLLARVVHIMSTETITRGVKAVCGIPEAVAECQSLRWDNVGEVASCKFARAASGIVGSVGSIITPMQKACVLRQNAATVGGWATQAFIIYKVLRYVWRFEEGRKTSMLNKKRTLTLGGITEGLKTEFGGTDVYAEEFKNTLGMTLRSRK
jgi:hypothetical protein